MEEAQVTVKDVVEQAAPQGAVVETQVDMPQVNVEVPDSDPATAKRSALAAFASSLLCPLTKEDFYDTDRLSKLVLPDATTKKVDIHLLNVRKLIKYIDCGGRMIQRKELEKQQPDLFCSEEMTTELLKEAANDDVTRSDTCMFPGIIALSYAWNEVDNPDPDGQRSAAGTRTPCCRGGARWVTRVCVPACAELQALLPVLAWYLSERAFRRKKSDSLSRGMGRGTHEAGIFIVCCLCYSNQSCVIRTKLQGSCLLTLTTFLCLC